MKQIKCKPLTMEAFRKFGSYQDMIQPDGEYIGNEPSTFYRDLLALKLGAANLVSISSLIVRERPLIIDVLEFHNHCGEAILPIDTDIIIQVAPATENAVIPYEKIEAFYVPRGIVVVLNYGIWHHAPFVIKHETGHIFCLLPERTYANDAHVFKIPADQRIEIIRE